MSVPNTLSDDEGHWAVLQPPAYASQMLRYLESQPGGLRDDALADACRRGIAREANTSDNEASGSPGRASAGSDVLPSTTDRLDYLEEQMRELQAQSRLQREQIQTASRLIHEVMTQVAPLLRAFQADAAGQRCGEPPRSRSPNRRT